jgi:drug/metabolite transporter (DMT)-like permease
MYGYLMGTTFLKSMNPYFRKHVLNTLNPREYFYLITFFVFILMIIVFFIFETQKTTKEMMSNYKKLEYSHYACVLIISVLLVASSLLLYELDKNYNTPLLNNILLKTGSIIVLIVVGVFVFGEKYTWKQILGIILTCMGIYLVIK